MPATRPLTARGARLVTAGLLMVLIATTAACSGAPGKADGPTGDDGLTAPALGACHALTTADTGRPSSDVAPVACAKEHTAQTFAIGTFPKQQYADAAYDARGLGQFIYRTCGPAFVTYLGSDESEVKRSLLSWAWFRPSKAAWAQGARWYRCDVVGGPDGADAYRALPTDAKNFLGGAPRDAWMLCAQGATVNTSKVPCTAQHDWRAVTTIKLGQPKDPYPGDRLVQIRSQQYCSDSVGAWMNYPATDFDYGMTIYHEAEWKAGNRRTICWARTTA